MPNDPKDMMKIDPEVGILGRFEIEEKIREAKRNYVSEDGSPFPPGRNLYALFACQENIMHPIVCFYLDGCVVIRCGPCDRLLDQIAVSDFGSDAPEKNPLAN